MTFLKATSRIMIIGLALLLSFESLAGKDRGGGEALPSPPITTWEMRELIMPYVKTDLLFFFNKRTFEPQSSYIARVLSGNPNIFSLIDAITIDVASTPCRDKDGNEVDASIIHRDPNTICLDLGTFEKLSHGEARKQILALVAHEFSHLLGFDERDAQNLQLAILRDLGEESSAQIEKMYHASERAIFSLRGAFMNYHASPSTSDWNGACYFSEKLLDYFNEFYGSDSLAQFKFFDLDSQKTHNAFITKAKVMRFASCGQSSFHPNRDIFKGMLKKIFGSETKLRAEQIEAYLTDTKIDPKIEILNIATFTDFEAELGDLESYIDQTYRRTRKYRAMYDKRYQWTWGKY